MSFPEGSPHPLTSVLMKGASRHRGDPRGCHGQTGPVLPPARNQQRPQGGVDRPPTAAEGTALPTPPFPGRESMQSWYVRPGLWVFAEKSQEGNTQPSGSHKSGRTPHPGHRQDHRAVCVTAQTRVGEGLLATLCGLRHVLCSWAERGGSGSLSV